MTNEDELLFDNTETELAFVEDPDNEFLELDIAETNDPEVTEETDESIPDEVRMIIDDAGREPLLSEPNEVELAKLIERGDTEARQRFIYANQRLVIDVAKRYLRSGLPFPDLIQEGNIGLIKAVEKFDYRRGFRFSTMATPWIRQTITRAIADTNTTIRVASYFQDKIRRVLRQATQHNTDIDSPNLAAVLEQPEKRISKIQEVARNYRLLSLDCRIGDGDDCLSDTIQDTEAMSPAEDVKTAILKDKIMESLDRLPPRESEILRRRSGLYDGSTQTLEDIARHFKVTRERVRQIEKKALDKLRKPHNAQLLEPMT